MGLWGWTQGVLSEDQADSCGCYQKVRPPVASRGPTCPQHQVSTACPLLQAPLNVRHFRSSVYFLSCVIWGEPAVSVTSVASSMVMSSSGAEADEYRCRPVPGHEASDAGCRVLRAEERERTGVCGGGEAASKPGSPHWAPGSSPSHAPAHPRQVVHNAVLTATAVD